MSEAVGAIFQDPLKYSWNWIQNQTHWIKNQLCCPTLDPKVRTAVIAARVFQGIAAVSAVASVGFAFAFGPLALSGLVAAVAFGALGTCMIVECERNISYLMEPPFVPGQPVGLRNTGNNCWLNAGLQILVQSSGLHPHLRRFPIFAQFLDAYQGSRNTFQKVAPQIDTQQLRQFLSRETRGVVSANFNQEDAAHLFEFLFGGGALYRFVHEINGTPSTDQPEPMIQLEVSQIREGASFQQLFKNFFDHRDDLGRRQQVFFPQAPSDLLIQLKRFYRTREGEEGKIIYSIDVPERITLSQALIRSGETGSYQCDAFLVHHGVSLNRGHYVAYVKRGETWWLCSDSSVREVSSDQAIAAMKSSYILHYAKT